MILLTGNHNPSLKKLIALVFCKILLLFVWILWNMENTHIAQNWAYEIAICIKVKELDVHQWSTMEKGMFFKKIWVKKHDATRGS